MRIIIPEFQTQKELFAYLADNDRDLIQQKKSMPIAAEPVYFKSLEKSGIEVKAANTDKVASDSIIVDVIANLSCWYDSHGDVSLPDSWKKSISERKNIPFIRDHSWSIESKIARTMEVYAMDINLKDLGVKSDVKTAQALIFKGEFNPRINEKMFEMYKNEMVDQHSIGLQYVQMDLALNDPDDKQHFKTWEKYYDLIINKSEVDKKGYFWAVKEQRIFENSAVLFGSNSMTPTISVTTAESLESGAGKTTLGNQKSNNEATKRLAEIFNI